MHNQGINLRLWSKNVSRETLQINQHIILEKQLNKEAKNILF